MNRLEELIVEFCPDGVEYRTLGEICELSAGGDAPKENFSKELTEDFTIPIYSNGIAENALYGYTDIAKITKPCITIAARGTIGYCVLRKLPFYPVVRLICAIPKDFMMVGFLKYYIDTITFQVPTSGIPQLTVPMVSKYKIPVPPLPVQSEIVRILDNFTELTAELTAKLEAEFTARRKQYEYYRDNLLNYGENEVKLDDIAKFSYGYTDKAKEHGNVRFIRITDINSDGYLKKEDAKYLELNDENKKYLVKTGDLLMARTGATYGKTLYVIDENPAIYASFLIKIELNNDVILNRFYWHFSKSNLYWNQANKLVTTGGQPQFNANALKQIIIPVPSLEEQARIVAILDRFDALYNDIVTGLPAEIKARTKQYEYYRDKLLTFKELS